ncbi:unnamed protein product [Absidia cylindrospora]
MDICIDVEKKNWCVSVSGDFAQMPCSVDFFMYAVYIYIYIYINVCVCVCRKTCLCVSKIPLPSVLFLLPSSSINFHLLPFFSLKSIEIMMICYGPSFVGQIHFFAQSDQVIVIFQTSLMEVSEYCSGKVFTRNNIEISGGSNKRKIFFLQPYSPYTTENKHPFFSFSLFFGYNIIFKVFRTHLVNDIQQSFQISSQRFYRFIFLGVTPLYRVHQFALHI